MNDKITEIFMGSPVEAEFIAKVLEDNNIEYLIRDLERESRIAGWVADIIPLETCKVFVFEKDYDRAMALLKEVESATFDEREMESDDTKNNQ